MTCQKSTLLEQITSKCTVIRHSKVTNNSSKHFILKGASGKNYATKQLHKSVKYFLNYFDKRYFLNKLSKSSEEALNYSVLMRGGATLINRTKSITSLNNFFKTNKQDFMNNLKLHTV